MPSGKCNTKSAYRACLQRLQELGEPKPRQVHPVTVQLLKQIWRNKYITPRVQAFGWRFIRKALPTGARAGKYSTHISKLCSRCGLEEDDIHLFFTCNFARAAWFSAPWFIRSNYLTVNCDSLSQIIVNLLNMNHPHASLANILTFMWCLWKSRNDHLFGRKEGAPHKIQFMAHEIEQNLELAFRLLLCRNMNPANKSTKAQDHNLKLNLEARSKLTYRLQDPNCIRMRHGRLVRSQVQRTERLQDLVFSVSISRVVTMSEYLFRPLLRPRLHCMLKLWHYFLLQGLQVCSSCTMLTSSRTINHLQGLQRRVRQPILRFYGKFDHTLQSSSRYHRSWHLLFIILAGI